LLEDIITEVDMVLLMSVNPGFGGQKFIANTTQKVHDLKALIARKNAHAIIQVDGGVNDKTGKELVEAGADSLVAGNYVFKSEDPITTIALLKQL
jgi:ribulose-phosphate 3-epimerase